MTDLPGLPAKPAREWLRNERPDLDLDRDWRPEIISGGLSNITYRLRTAGGSYILRRPPLGPVLPRAHDMYREYRVLAALWPTSVPVPEPLAMCADPGVIGAPFYLMREVRGAVLRSAMDTCTLTVEQRGQVAEQLVQTLAELHAVDPDAAGLGDYGRHGGYAARQIRTWGQQWRRSRTRELPDMDRLLDALAAELPPDRETTIVHGDFRLDNTIIDVDGPPRVAAVLDWELSTLGDPLADLGLMLTYWHEPGDYERSLVPVAAGITDLPGFPSCDCLADRYAQLSGRDIADLPFYLALGAMKLAVILEGVHARHLAGNTVGAGYEQAGAGVPVLVERGLRLISRNR
jgi:aminoglycoside phosphotransferase (APT) family kinase protein